MTTVEPDDATEGGPHDADSWLLRWGPAVGFAVVILLGSVVPIPVGPSGGSDGSLPFGLGLTDPFHLVGYAVLAALAVRGTGRTGVGLVVAAALATGFGFGIELLQAPIPWRSFSWGDVIVNAVGAATGAFTVGIAIALAGRYGPDRTSKDRGQR